MQEVHSLLSLTAMTWRQCQPCLAKSAALVSVAALYSDMTSTLPQVWCKVRLTAQNFQRNVRNLFQGLITWLTFSTPTMYIWSWHRSAMYTNLKGNVNNFSLLEPMRKHTNTLPLRRVKAVFGYALPYSSMSFKSVCEREESGVS